MHTLFNCIEFLVKYPTIKTRFLKLFFYKQAAEAINKHVEGLGKQEQKHDETQQQEQHTP